PILLKIRSPGFPIHLLPGATWRLMPHIVPGVLKKVFSTRPSPDTWKPFLPVNANGIARCRASWNANSGSSSTVACSRWALWPERRRRRWSGRCQSQEGVFGLRPGPPSRLETDHACANTHSEGLPRRDKAYGGLPECECAREATAIHTHVVRAREPIRPDDE